MSQPQTPPPHIQIIQMGTGYWVSRLVGAAASLGLADHLANGPQVCCRPRRPDRDQPARSSSVDAEPRGLRHPEPGWRRQVCADRARRRAQERCAGIGAIDHPRDVGNLDVEGLRRVSVLARDGQDGDGESVRDAAVRLSRAASEGVRAIQRSNGRHPRPGAAGCRRSLRFFVVRFDRRRRRSHRQHAGSHSRAIPSTEGRSASTVLTWSRKRRRCFARGAWRIGSRSNQETSSSTCRPGATSTSCRTSSTIGTRISA